MVGKYRVVTLCGNTGLKEAFNEAQKKLTLEGNIVISAGLFDDAGEEEARTESTKEMLEEMRLRRIDLADEIFVINQGGDPGSSTLTEIEYAGAHGKKVRYLDPREETLPAEEKKKAQAQARSRVPGEKRKVTEVVAALIRDGKRFMICQRPAHKARGLLWEFVGGKVEPGETKEEALIRECREELDIGLSVGEEFMEVLHEYPDLTVRLTLFNAEIASGRPKKLEHNDIRWIRTEEIEDYEFCPADEEILAELKRRESPAVG